MGLVPKGGLEPPCQLRHNALNVACLPISPFRRVTWCRLDKGIVQDILRIVKSFFEGCSFSMLWSGERWARLGRNCYMLGGRVFVGQLVLVE